MAKLWAGRFEKQTSKLMDDFHSSIPFDQRLLRCDIIGSIAHAAMLKEQSVLSQADGDAIVSGLNAILADEGNGSLTVDMGAEDVHMFVEAELTARIGEAGKRLHTGRSRNDQVALDTRMYAKLACEDTVERLHALLTLLLTLIAVFIIIFLILLISNFIVQIVTFFQSIYYELIFRA